MPAPTCTSSSLTHSLPLAPPVGAHTASLPSKLHGQLHIPAWLMGCCMRGSTPLPRCLCATYAGLAVARIPSCRCLRRTVLAAGPARCSRPPSSPLPTHLPVLLDPAHNSCTLPHHSLLTPGATWRLFVFRQFLELCGPRLRHVMVSDLDALALGGGWCGLGASLPQQQLHARFRLWGGRGGTPLLGSCMVYPCLCLACMYHRV